MGENGFCIVARTILPNINSFHFGRLFRAALLCIPSFLRCLVVSRFNCVTYVQLKG